MQDVPVDRLGPYPILQLAAAIVVLGGLTLAIWRGTRDRKAQGPQLPEEARWFFDGPLAMAINILRDIKSHLSRIVEQNEEIKDELRKVTDGQHDIKNAVENWPHRRRR